MARISIVRGMEYHIVVNVVSMACCLVPKTQQYRSRRGFIIPVHALRAVSPPAILVNLKASTTRLLRANQFYLADTSGIDFEHHAYSSSTQNQLHQGNQHATLLDATQSVYTRPRLLHSNN